MDVETTFRQINSHYRHVFACNMLRHGSLLLLQMVNPFWLIEAGFRRGGPFHYFLELNVRILVAAIRRSLEQMAGREEQT